MLYQIYETQRTMMEPFVDFAQAAAKLYSNPLTPAGQNPLAQRVAAGYSLLNMTRLREAGSFELMMASVVLPSPYRAGDEAGPMAMLHAPLATEVRRIH